MTAQPDYVPAVTRATSTSTICGSVAESRYPRDPGSPVKAGVAGSSREPSAADEGRGWGRTLWARLHWITAAIITAIAVGVLLLIELG